MCNYKFFIFSHISLKSLSKIAVCSFSSEQQPTHQQHLHQRRREQLRANLYPILRLFMLHTE